MSNQTAMIKQAQEVGWKVQKWGSVWKHWCPQCMAKDEKAFKMKFEGDGK